jgi:hypothetical protein
MTASFLTPILNRHAAEIEAEVAQAIADINARLTGLSLGSPAAKPPVSSGRAGKVAKGAKRSPEELEQLTKKLLGYISKNPGQRIEQIGGGLGISTKELILSAKKLIGDGSVKTKGQKRATAYFSK